MGVNSFFIRRFRARPAVSIQTAWRGLPSVM
uniref:Uncharacterized protein n=1 Tax=Anguilla anguilla TaxID=7936 RepID=A0A0E9VH20_ANGAN